MFVYLKNIIKLVIARFYRVFSIKAAALIVPRFFDVLERNYKEGEPFNCILVGANDGISHDDLYTFLIKRKTSGLAIEPLPDAYNQLKKNFALMPGMLTVRMAVHPYEKKVRLYHVNPERLSELPFWASGIASLNKDHHKKSDIPAEYMTFTEVEANHLMNIIEQYTPNRQPDLMQIDTEGFDYEILKQIDFGQLKPRIIRYEYFCLNKEDEIASIKLLKSKGYFCFYDDIDVIGVRLRNIKV